VFSGSTFTRCFEFVQVEGWAILRALTNKTQVINQIAGSRVYISRLPTDTSLIFSSWIKHTASILNYLDIMWLAQYNSSRSKTHPISYTTLYFHSGLPFSMFNWTIMLTARMLIHFLLTAMAPKGSFKWMGKAMTTAKMPTAVIVWDPSLDRDHIKAFISEHIRGLILIFTICGFKNKGARDLM